MDRAFRLLSHRARSEAEIRIALEAAGHAAREVRRVVGRLRALGYIDDAKLAADVAERLGERGFGSLRIRDQLRNLGVEDGLAAAAISAPAEERRIASRTLNERFGEDAPTDLRRRARAARFLASRGFPEEIIRSLIPFDD
jgi:regulatory protein